MAIDVRETLASIIVGLGVDAERIVDEAGLVRDLELDSTDTVEVSLELKRALGVEVNLAGISDLTVGEVLRRIDAARVADLSAPQPA
jgi:acyl carrier protein